jgi:hypothetical protein
MKITGRYYVNWKMVLSEHTDVFLVSNVGRLLELNSHLQTAFYLLMLGYVKALACFVTVIMWHSYRSKGRGPIGTTMCHGYKVDTVERPD